MDKCLTESVRHYWLMRNSQRRSQRQSGKPDQGLRGAVTGGSQMDGFVHFFAKMIVESGLTVDCVHQKKALELPGFFRPTKEWDIVVVKNKKILAVIELKSQVGPSFGNNFNNRTEEAMGSALDLWTAYREKAFSASPQPFLGYFFMLEACPASMRPVKVREPHFPVFNEFRDASYMKRYEIFCRKLMLERHYTAVAFITSNQGDGIDGAYSVPAEDLSVVQFMRTLAAHMGAFAES